MSLWPDGIDGAKGEARGRDAFATPLAALLLAIPLIFGCLGLAGGHPNPVETVRFGDAALTMKMPSIIRNGEFFETEIVVTPNRTIADAVLSVDASLWRDMTINSFYPTAEQEDYKDGAFRFSFGRLDPGEPLRVKIDGQINPPLFAGNEGTIALFDGDRLIGATRRAVRVLP